MPTHALAIVTLLLGFVLNTEDWMQEKSMQVLKIILAFPEARAPLATHGEQLLLPLLKLVTTKHSAQALEVLDIPATGGSSDAENQEEIFGPISDSGWSVPNIEEISDITRENLKAVFNTCTVETRAASAHFSVVQFADIKQFAPNPSFTSFDSQELGPESPGLVNPDLSTASLGDLAGQLHALNQFFDDGLDDEEPKRAFGHAQMPSETLSERRIRAILAVSSHYRRKGGADQVAGKKRIHLFTYQGGVHTTHARSLTLCVVVRTRKATSQSFHLVSLVSRT
jgi:hypothetical protein